VGPSIDFAVGGGWHVTLFHPWAWMGAGVILVMVVAAVFKLAMAR
jgi:hypothetical protein